MNLKTTGLMLLLLLFNNNTIIASNIMNNDKNLTELQKNVIFQNGTERAFDNEYWNNKAEGIYVDVVSGKPLFSSKDKFDSGTGWPSFTRPINDNSIKEKTDYSHGMSRTEARSKDSDIHLGHIFSDDPKNKGGTRYCINSASLRFIPKENLKKEGYEEYLKIFDEQKEIKHQKALAGLLNSRFYKKMLGTFFFDDAVDTNIHKESKNKITTQFEVKVREFNSAVVSGGCFWGMEDLFSKLAGVIDVVNGYSGGNIPNPTYEIVSSGISNHAESIEITFDPAKISYEKILRFFFKIHDPTTLNKQGNDIGTQYRSAIFYSNEEQKKIAQDLIDKANKSGLFPKKIVTSLEKFDKFYKAEEYHQNYLSKNPNGYTCHSIRKDWEF